MNLQTLKQNWVDNPSFHEEINNTFLENVNNNPELKELRDWVEKNIWGFGERSFYWMWKLIVDEMPKTFTFMEIGVFRGQILALIELLAQQSGKTVKRIGISPLDSSDGYWESNYELDIMTLHNTFSLPCDYKLIKGLSTDSSVIKEAYNHRVDILYIDGGHRYDVVKSDNHYYPSLINKGGYLIMDDCCNNFNLPNGYFRGHVQVSKAVDEDLPPVTPSTTFEFIGNVVHNRIWKKIK